MRNEKLLPILMQSILALAAFANIARAQLPGVAASTATPPAATNAASSQSQSEQSPATTSSTTNRAGETSMAQANTRLQLDLRTKGKTLAKTKVNSKGSADQSVSLSTSKFGVVNKPSPSSSFTANSDKASEDEAKDQQGAAPAQSEESAAELAKKLANPLASMISFPMQSNFDFRMGTGSGWKYTLNMQPVIPIALSPKWNLISRTIIPIIHQSNVTAPGASQSGLGDITQSLFFSPNKSEPFIWGVGPVILIPTATNQFLGAQKLGLGPTVVVLKQQHGWTVGTLANHIWSVAGKSSRANVNSTFLQPFLTYGTKDGWTYAVNTESSYNWLAHNWGVPIHATVQKLVRFGHQPIAFQGGLRCWVTSPSGGPESCGVRIVVTALFPKK